MRQLPVALTPSGPFVLLQAPLEVTEDSPLEAGPSSGPNDRRVVQNEDLHNVHSENLFQRTEVLAGEHLQQRLASHLSLKYLSVSHVRHLNCD